MVDMVQDTAVLMIRQYLDKYNIADYHFVADSTSAAYLTRDVLLYLASLWLDAILIDSSDPSASMPKLGVIDWEFQDPGRRINGGMAQLLAHLHLYLFASKLCQPRSPVYSAVLALIEGIDSPYHARSLVNSGALWAPDSLMPSYPPLRSSPVARILRSTVIIRGREIIYKLSTMRLKTIGAGSVRIQKMKKE